MELFYTHDIIPIQKGNDYLREENVELRKLVGLVQENYELKRILQSTANQFGEIPSPVRKELKHTTYEDNDSPEQEEIQVSSGVELIQTVMHPPQNANELQRMQRIIGEIAFQLDRRILANVFQENARLYGITLSNIPHKIAESATDHTGKENMNKKAAMTERHHMVIEKLKKCGYDPMIHPIFSEYIVNTYGVIKECPPAGSEKMLTLCDPENLYKIACYTVPSAYLQDVLVLLKCLCTLSAEDRKTLFVW